MDKSRNQKNSPRKNEGRERRRSDSGSSQKSGQTGTLEDQRESDADNRERSRFEEESGISGPEKPNTGTKSAKKQASVEKDEDSDEE